MRPAAARLPSASRTDPFPGDSQVAALLRAHDWAASPLGHPEDWSPSLLVALRICLESKSPVTVMWGPRLVQLYNDAYVPLLGNKHPASLARPFQENWPEIWSTVRPVLEAVIERGAAASVEDEELAIERRGFPEQVYFTFSDAPIREADGSVGGIFATGSETTARVRTERRLALLRDIGYEVKVDVNATAGDALERLGRATDDLSFAALSLRHGSSRRRLIVSRALPTSTLATLRGAATRAGASMRREWITVPGSAPIRARAFPLPGDAPAQGDVLFLGEHPGIPDDDQYRSFLDLLATTVHTELARARARETERRRADSLVRLDHAKTTFFTNVSHEFRTPLMLIDAPLRELAEDPSLPAEHRARIEMARRASRRLRRLANTLLEFSRVQAGASRPVVHVVDLVQALTDVASVFRSAFDRVGLVLEVGDDGSAPRVLADPGMLERILLNLVSNAFKFTQHGGVRLVARSTKSSGIVEVIDTGVGIAPEHLDRIFDRFTRINARWARSSEGSGIGLALASELASIQDGSLDVESSPGRGTTFRLSLPRASGTATLARRDVLERESYADEAAGWVRNAQVSATRVLETVPGSPPARILVVDDNADLGAYVGRILGRRWSVEVLSDGNRAFERIVADPPDLVVADVMIPGIDGLELVRRIRGDDRLATLPVLLLSARAGDEARHEGLAAGADEYIVKPFAAPDLVVRVESHVKRNEAHRAQRAALAANQAELRRMVDRLRESERDLTNTLEVQDDFVGMVSHEIRTPVTTIRGNAELLLTKANTLAPEVLTEAIDDIAVEAERLSDVTENLLALTRAEQQRLDAKPVVVSRLIEHAVSDALREYHGRRVHLDLQKDLFATADDSAVEQILRNLLTNAFKYGDPGVPVTISASSVDGHIEISVRDRGIRLSDTDRERAFEPFYRAQGTQMVAGMGIGLTVGRRLARAVGGSLRADPYPDGASFTLSLPALRVQDEP